MPSDADTVLGVILAGGAGSRVEGADKGLLPLAGRPLVQHVAARLRPHCRALLVVANRNLDRYADCAPTIHDESPGHQGPLAGLAAAFAFAEANFQAEWRWLLTVPVDCPDPPADLAARLRSVLDADSESPCAFVQRGGRAQPLFALYRLAKGRAWWRDSARAALAEHGSVWRWHATLGGAAVDFDDARDAFHNLNTPADFGAFEHRHGHA